MPSSPTTENTLAFPIAFAALFMGAVAMGASPVFVRYSEVGPFASAFWRVALALPVLFLWAALEVRSQGSSIKSVVRFDTAILLCGLFFAGDLIFWHLAIVNTTMANATLMACLAPVWVVLLSGPIIGEPVGRNAYIGLFLCLIGAALLISSSFTIAPERLWGDIYGLITSLFFGFYFLSVRVARRRHRAGAMTFMSTIVTAIILLGVAVATGQSLAPQTLVGVGALITLGIFSHAGGQGLLAIALGSLSAAFSSLVIFIEAVAAAVLGWLVFAERLTPLQFAGALLILIGIAIARPRQAKPTH